MIPASVNVDRVVRLQLELAVECKRSRGSDCGRPEFRKIAVVSGEISPLFWLVDEQLQHTYSAFRQQSPVA